MKLKFLFILSVLPGIFSSCAVSKYDYYYCKLESDNSAIKRKSNDNFNSYLFELRHDSNVYEMYITLTTEKITQSIKNPIPVYIDYSNSTVMINGIESKLNISKKDSIIFLEP